MPATNFPEYIQEIEDILNATIAAGEAVSVSIQFDQRSALRGFIIGLLQFNDDSELHFREFVDINLPGSRLMYAYHYQDANQKLIFRYDNAAHRPALSQAEHKHISSDVIISPAASLAEVIDEILQET